VAKVKLYGKKEVRAAAYNRMAARYFLKLAEDSEEGQFFTSQSSLLFSAFIGCSPHRPNHIPFLSDGNF
jgi:hypothetical protein